MNIYLNNKRNSRLLKKLLITKIEKIESQKEIEDGIEEYFHTQDLKNFFTYQNNSIESVNSQIINGDTLQILINYYHQTNIINTTTRNYEDFKRYA